MDKNENNNDYFNWIDKLRGFAIVLVIFGHTITQANDGGLNVSSLFNYLFDVVANIHIPILFIISGYVSKYNFSYESDKKLKCFVRYLLKITFSIYIPYLCFIYIYAVLKIVSIQFLSFNAASNISTIDLTTLFVKPVSLFWFLFALYLIKILDGLMNLMIRKKWKYSIVWLTLCTIGAFFNWYESFYSYIFIYLGYGLLFHFGAIIKRNKKIKVLNLPKILISISFVIIGFLIPVPLNSYICKFFIGAGSGYLAIAVLIKNDKILANAFTFIGKYSMIPYLLHGIILTIARTVIIKSGITNAYLFIIISFVIVIIISKIVITFFEKVKYLGWIEYLFYPLKNKYLKKMLSKI